VRDRALHAEVLRTLARFAGEAGLGVVGVADSRVPGAEGNLEFFLHLVPGAAGLGGEALDGAVDAAVARAHEGTA
jgi:23S rRNA (cytidine1920-2'-O)/16S rRNA (cytidine1409-2'-O)-methyltransferase